MVTLKRRHDLITVLKPHFLPKRLRSTKSYFIKAIDHIFYGFTGVITHLGCWENTRKTCKSRAELSKVHHLLYSLLAPKWQHFAFQRSISYFLTLSNQNLCPWCNTGGESVHKLSREKHRHFSLYVQNISGYRGKERRFKKYQNEMSFQISLCHRSKIIMNQNEW